MRLLLALFTLLSCTAPQEPDEALADLVRKLGSDDPALRDAATLALARRERSAEPALRTAAASNDPELRRRAEHLLYRLELLRVLPPELRTLDPQMVDRLWTGDEANWTHSFLSLFEDEGAGEAHSRTLKADLLDPLARRALSGATQQEDREKILSIVTDYGLRSPTPLLVKIALDAKDEYTLRVGALDALAAAAVSEAAPTTLELLGRRDDVLREHACDVAGRLRLQEGAAALLKILGDPRNRHRARAGLALARLGKVEAIPGLVTLLDGADAPEAADALVLLGSPAAVPELAARMQQAPRPELQRALVALGFIGAGKELIDLLGHAQPDVRAVGAEILGIVGEPLARGPLQAVLRNDAAPSVRCAAFRALTILDGALLASLLPELLREGPPELRAAAVELLASTEAAAALLGDADARVRRAAVTALGLRGSIAERRRIEPLLKDSVADVADSAATVLASWGVEEAGPALLGLLKSTDEGLLSRAIPGVRKLRPPGALEAARRLIREPQAPWSGRRKAAEILVAAAADSADAELEALLDGKEADVVQAVAVEVLGGRRAPSSPPKVLALLRADTGPETLSAAFEFLLRRPIPEGGAAILRILDDLNGPLADGALRTLGFLASGGSAEALKARIKSPEALSPTLVEAVASAGLRDSIPEWRALLGGSDRDYAIDALGRLGDRDSVARIRPFLSSRFAATRTIAVRTLRRLAGRDGVADLKPLLGDRSALVRAEAADALGRLQAAELIPELLRLLEDPEPEASAAAAKALARLGRREGVPRLLREAARSDVDLRELNALRNPGDWKKLTSTRPGRPLFGTLGELAVRLASESGFRFAADPETRIGGLEREAGIGIARSGDPESAEEAWEFLLDQAYDPHDELLLSEGTLNVVTRTAALRFWRRWALSR